MCIVWFQRLKDNVQRNKLEKNMRTWEIRAKKRLLGAQWEQLQGKQTQLIQKKKM